MLRAPLLDARAASQLSSQTPPRPINPSRVRRSRQCSEFSSAGSLLDGLNVVVVTDEGRAPTPGPGLVSEGSRRGPNGSADRPRFASGDSARRVRFADSARGTVDLEAGGYAALQDGYYDVDEDDALAWPDTPPSGGNGRVPLLEPTLSAGWWPAARSGGSFARRQQPWQRARGKTGKSSRAELCMQSLCVFLALVVAGAAAARLLQLGLLTPPDLDVPLLVNGSAQDRRSGVAFALQAAPPGDDGLDMTLLGMAAHADADGARAWLVGLYARPGADEQARWRELRAARNVTALAQSIEASEAPLALRAVLLRPVNGSMLAVRWGSEVGDALDSLWEEWPWNADEDRARFERWFPPQLRLGDELWIVWDRECTTFFVQGEQVDEPAASAIGHATMRAELARRGAALTSLA